MAKKPTKDRSHRVAVFLDSDVYAFVREMAIVEQSKRGNGHASMAGYIESLIAREREMKPQKLRDSVYRAV